MISKLDCLKTGAPLFVELHVGVDGALFDVGFVVSMPLFHYRGRVLHIFPSCPSVDPTFRPGIFGPPRAAVSLTVSGPRKNPFAGVDDEKVTMPHRSGQANVHR